MISLGQSPTLPCSTATFSCCFSVLVQAVTQLARSHQTEFFLTCKIRSTSHQQTATLTVWLHSVDTRWGTVTRGRVPQEEWECLLQPSFRSMKVNVALPCKLAAFPSLSGQSPRCDGIGSMAMGAVRGVGCSLF